MSDELRPDAEAWGQDDWAADTEPVRPKAPAPTSKGGRLGLAIAAVVGLVLLIGLFVWMRSQETARDMAEMERHLADGEHQAREAEFARLNASPKPKPHPQEEPAIDPVEAMRLIARDPESLNAAGLFLLNQMDEPEEAIEKFEEAAKQDPKYNSNLELARKRKVQKERTAPQPRPLD